MSAIRRRDDAAGPVEVANERDRGVRVVTLGVADAEAVNAVLCDAFAAYPVMRYVLGDGPAYPLRLRRLVGLFTAARWMRGHPMLGVRTADGKLTAVATLTPRGESETPPPLATLTEATWELLGDDAWRRYAVLREAWAETATPGACWHLNMLGVARAHRGRGYGSVLLAAARALAARDPGAEALDLTTEDPANLLFYLDHGFTVTGDRRVTLGLHTWTLVARGNPCRDVA